MESKVRLVRSELEELTKLHRQPPLRDRSLNTPLTLTWLI